MRRITPELDNQLGQVVSHLEKLYLLCLDWMIYFSMRELSQVGVLDDRSLNDLERLQL